MIRLTYLKNCKNCHNNYVSNLTRVELVEQSHGGIDMQGGHARYTEVINHPLSRCQAYCDRLVEQLKMPAFAPQRPALARVDVQRVFQQATASAV
jgi:hypothetical protein